MVAPARPSSSPGFYRLLDCVDDDIPTLRENAEEVARAAKERAGPEQIRDRLRYSLTLVEGPEAGRIIPITQETVLCGRADDCVVRILQAGVSRTHARLSVRHRQLVVEDLESANGTFVDGERITARTKLDNGARLHLGPRVLLRVQLLDAVETKSSQRIFRAALRDELTGLVNRTSIIERMREEIAFARRHESPLAILVLDVDHFKKVNDTYGHAGGDAVLVEMGRALKETLRTEDVVARWGGEEFLVVARAVPIEGAAILAERIRRTIEQSVAKGPQGETIRVTSSVGVAMLGPRHRDEAALVHDADVALYEAKQAGRNCVRMSRAPAY